MKILTVVFLSMVSCLLHAAVQPESLSGQHHLQTVVSKIDYKGWQNSIELKNGLVKVIVVPQIGRIMHYGFIDGENLLIENQDLIGQVMPQQGPRLENGIPVSTPFGGDRVWPMSQDYVVQANGYKRPTDHWLDGGRYDYQLIDQGVVITSQISEFAGVSVKRRIELADKQAFVTISQTMEKHRLGINESEDFRIPLTLWNITKIKLPSQTLMPLNKRSVFSKGYHAAVWNDAINHGPKYLSMDDGLAVFYPPKKGSGKIGIDAPGWVAGVIDGIVMAEYFHYDPQENYPDGGTSATVFADSTQAELECLSPEVVLNIGEKIQHTIIWDLHQLTFTTKDLSLERKAAVNWITNNRNMKLFNFFNE